MAYSGANGLNHFRIVSFLGMSLSNSLPSLMCNSSITSLETSPINSSFSESAFHWCPQPSHSHAEGMPIVLPPFTLSLDVREKGTPMELEWNADSLTIFKRECRCSSSFTFVLSCAIPSMSHSPKFSLCLHLSLRIGRVFLILQCVWSWTPIQKG